MKTQTKIENLKKLVAKCDAQSVETSTSNELKRYVEHARVCSGYTLSPIILEAAREGYRSAISASNAFKSIKPEWRTLAEQTKLKAESIALTAAKMGRNYSGSTEYLVEWRDKIAQACGQAPVLAGSGATWWLDGAFLELAKDLPKATVLVTQTR